MKEQRIRGAWCNLLSAIAVCCAALAGACAPEVAGRTNPPVLTALWFTIDGETQKEDERNSVLELIDKETGEPVVEFNGNFIVYTAILPEGNTPKIKINAQASGNSEITFSHEDIFTPVQDGTTIITITDKTNYWKPRQYIVIYSSKEFAGGAEEAEVNRAMLTSVTLSAGSTGELTGGLFDNGTRSQAVNLPAGITSITAAATPEEGGSVEYSKKVKPLQLAEGGLTTLSMYVSKAGKNPSTYTLFFSVPSAGGDEPALMAVPFKARYVTGQSVQPNDLAVYRRGADGITVKVPTGEFSISPDGALTTPGEQTITVTNSNLATSYKVLVTSPQAAPSPHIYITGGAFPENARITYTNGVSCDAAAEPPISGYSMVYTWARPAGITDGDFIRKLSAGDKEILLGRRDNEIIVLNLDEEANIDFRPAGTSGYIPVGSYAEFQLINRDAEARSKKYRLESDLDFLGRAPAEEGGVWTGEDWMPIGTYAFIRNNPQPTIDAAFSGEFDGLSHSIYNLYINRPEGRAALFGTIYSGVIIRDIHIVSGSVSGGSSASISSYGTWHISDNRQLPPPEIINCANGASINGNSASGIGSSGNGNIINCYNSGAITGIYGAYGIGSGANIINCYNEGTITGGRDAAGIGSGSDNNFINCHNSGAVSTSIYDSGNFNDVDRCFTAGIASYTTGYIINCSNSGTITGAAVSGGIAGKVGKIMLGSNTAKRTITACQNSGTVTSTSSAGGVTGLLWYGAAMTACYNTGEVSAALDAGGLTAVNTLSTIEACYSTGKVTGGISSGGIAGFFVNPSEELIEQNQDTLSTTPMPKACYWDSSTPGAPVYGGNKQTTSSTSSLFHEIEETLYGSEYGMEAFNGASGFPNLSAKVGVDENYAEWGTGTGNEAGAYWKAGTTSGGQLPKLWWETN